MQLTDFINEHKNKLLNAVIILVALLIANRIYKAQTATLVSLKGRKALEIKKNAVLGEISQSEKRLNLYKSSLNKKDASLVMNTVNNLARDSGVKIVSIKPQSEKRYPVYIKYPFDLNVEAESYHAIGKFISKLESHPQIYLVEQVTLRKVAGRAQAGPTADKLNLDLKLSTLAFRD